MKVHYMLGPSAAPAYVRCAAKPSREAPYPRSSSTFADDGTVTHDLGERSLKGDNVALLQGLFGTVDERGEVTYEIVGDFEVDADRLARVETYASYVRSIPGELLVEVAVPVGHVTGEDGATGTSDAIVVGDDIITVIDLKDGRGVEVEAEGNEQGLLYLEGARKDYGWMTDFKRGRIVIVQPKLNKISEWVVTAEELAIHIERIRAAAEATRAPNPAATPGEKQCKFCRAAGDCPEYAALVHDSVFDEFDNVVEPTDLGKAMSLVPLIEGWCAAVRKKLFDDLQAGKSHPGWKLVEGRRGARRWKSKEVAEEILVKKMRLKHEDAYEYSLISPTQAEKLLAKSHPRKWAKVLDLIEQPDGSPSVAPESDKRPAINVSAVADEFADDDLFGE